MIRAEAKEKKPRVYGYHVYGDLYECDEEVLKDEERLRKIVEEAAKRGNMTLLDVKSWKIGEGVSVVGIVLESHISIHTWPEYRFATVDAYTCGAHTKPGVAFDYIVSMLGAKRVRRGEFERTLE
ncbi:MAG: adenosylmethionine decarboxylase [Acidilobaceae archaeon]|nr:adenosylmethionine decarboxylase [Acidilobaceae archaeon]